MILPFANTQPPSMEAFFAAQEHVRQARKKLGEHESLPDRETEDWHERREELMHGLTDAEDALAGFPLEWHKLHLANNGPWESKSGAA